MAVLLKIVLFFVFSGVVGFFARKLVKYWFDRHDNTLRRFSVLSFAFCLIFAYVAEHFFGVADITGAFIAGLIISNTSKCTYVASRIETLSYMLISPVFFASIGLKVVLPELSTQIFILLYLALRCCIVIENYRLSLPERLVAPLYKCTERTYRCRYDFTW